MAEDICLVSGCGRIARTKGWCNLHYQRWLKHRDLGGAEPMFRQSGTPCAVADCGTPVTGRKDYCSIHYMRWLRWGDPLGRRHLYHLVPVKPGFHWCPQCQQELPVANFGPKRSTKSGLSRWCRTCTKHRHLAGSFGLTLEEFNERVAQQDGRCAICRGPETRTIRGKLTRMAVDHDHRSCCPGYRSCRKCLRGILCNRCNRVLGLIEDNPEIAEALANYLRSWAKNSGDAGPLRAVPSGDQPFTNPALTKVQP